MSVPSSTAQPQSQPYTKTEFKPHELNHVEIDKIPEDQKKALFAMPGEEGSIWQEFTTNKGYKMYSTSMDDLLRKAPAIISMLMGIQHTTFTHVALGGFTFKYNPDSQKISRGIHKKTSTVTGTSKGFTPWQKTPAKPKFLADVYVDTPDNVRAFLEKPENKGKWEVMRDPVIGTDGKVVVFIARYQYD